MRYSDIKERRNRTRVPAFIFLRTGYSYSILDFDEAEEALHKDRESSRLYLLDFGSGGKNNVKDHVNKSLKNYVRSKELVEKYKTVNKKRVKNSKLESYKWVDALLERWILNTKVNSKNSKIRVEKEKHGKGKTEIKVLPNETSMYERMFGYKKVEIKIDTKEFGVKEKGKIINHKRDVIISFGTNSMTLRSKKGGDTRMFVDPKEDKIKGSKIPSEVRRDFMD